VQAFRINLPVHVRVLRLRLAHVHRVPACGVGADEPARIVVHAEEVDRRPDRLEVAFDDGRAVYAEVLEDVLRIAAAEDRIEEPAVVKAVDVVRRRGVGLVRRGRIHRM